MLCCVTIFSGLPTMHLGLRRIPFAVFIWALPRIPRQQTVAVEEFCTYFLGRTMNRSNTYPQGLDEYSTGIQRIQNWGDGMLVRSKMLCWYQHCQAPTEWSMPMQPGLSGRSRVDTSAFASGKVTFCTLQFHQQQTEDIKTNYEISKQHLHWIHFKSGVISLNHTESTLDICLGTQAAKMGILISRTSCCWYHHHPQGSSRPRSSTADGQLSQWRNAISVIYNL